MEHLRGIVTAGLIALAGAGGGVVGITLHAGSPRLFTAGIVAVVVGIIGGGVMLSRMSGPTR